jgi:transposase
MLRMDQVHVIRHQVLVEGRSQRQVAKEFGISRLTVRKYVAEAAPRRKETGPRARPVWDKVGARIEALLVASAQWTGGKQRLTATRLHALLVAEGHAVGVTVVKDAVADALGRREVEGVEGLHFREARLAEPLADHGLVPRRLLRGEHLMEVVFVRPVRIARLAGERFKGARDAGQFQRPCLRDDEITREGGDAHATPPSSQPS